MNIETISRGPQFKGILSTLGLVVFVFSLVIGIVTCVNDEYAVGLVILLVSAVALNLFLGVQGMEIDHDKQLVRSYKQFLWLRSGEWTTLNDYTQLHLVKDNFYVRTSPLPNMLGPGSGGAHSKVSTYDIVLWGEKVQQPILMSEFADHKEATAFMQEYAEKLSLPARDIYRELQASAVSRRAGSTRR